MKPIVSCLSTVGVAAALAFFGGAQHPSRQPGNFKWPIPTSPSASATPSRAGRTRLEHAYGRLPLSFEANQGQADPHVKFFSRGRGYTLFLTSTEALLALSKSSPQAAPPDPRRARGVEQEKIATTTLRIKLAGGNAQARLTGMEKLPGKSNYFIGDDPKQWRTNVANYAKVRYQDVYPGVDLVYHGNQQQLEQDFIIAPGAHPEAITLNFEDAEKLSIDAQGDLVLTGKESELRLKKPDVYQNVQGMRQEIAAAYMLKGEKQVGFKVSTYDVANPLVIDPVLAYSTYLGVYGGGQGIAVDSAGSAYITGFTYAPIAVTPGAFQTMFGTKATPGGDSDVFVTKLSADGSSVVYSTYLGGSNNDFAAGIALDSANNAYVTGETNSSDFPTTQGAYQTSLVGNSDDVFVAKLSADGSSLVYSTYLGGANGGSLGTAIAVDSAGSAYVTGNTFDGFPTTAGAYQTTFAGGGALSGDPFVTKLSADGSSLSYSTYLGGSGVGSGIQLDSAGNAYVTGYTASTSFPTTAGVYQTNFGTTGIGRYDGFVTKLNATGSSLVYSTFLHGSVTDRPSAIALDSLGNAYVTGYTDSADFPTTAGAFQTAFGSKVNPKYPDVFVTKLSPDGLSVLYSTYLGGSGYNYSYAIAVDSADNAYVTGYTDSTDFPSANSIQSCPAAGSFFFVTMLNAAGSGLGYSTCLGIGLGDQGQGIVVDSTGSAYITGLTSGGFPTTSGAYQTTFATAGGNFDGFVAKVSTGFFSLSVTSPINIGVGGSAVSSVSVGSLDGYSSLVDLSASAPPSGVSTSFNPSSVMPPSGSSASSTLTVSLQPFVTPTSFILNVTGASGLLSRSTPLNVGVISTTSSIQSVIRALDGAGCIRLPFGNQLISELSFVQAVINFGDRQLAIDILELIQLQIQSLAGRGIATSCSIGGVAFNPVTVLQADVQSLIGTL